LTLLLEAFACISDPKPRLVVVGHIERSGRPVLSRLAKETRAVHFERVDDKTRGPSTVMRRRSSFQASARGSASQSSRPWPRDAP
jgi:hypothetical protein